MEIPPQANRLPTLDVVDRLVTRTSAVVSEVFGNRDLVDAIVRQVSNTERAHLQSGDHSGREQRQAELQRLTLQIGNRNLEVLSERALQPGQTLTLRQLGEARLQVVAIDGRPVVETPAAQRQADLVNRLLDGLRASFPAQDSPAPLVRTLTALIQPQVQVALQALREAAGLPPGDRPPAAAAPVSGSAPGQATQPGPTGSPGPGPTTAEAAAQAGAQAGARTGPAGETPLLPPRVLDAVNRLLQSLPDARSVRSPAGVEQAIRNSGTFLEARLAAAVANPDPVARGTAAGEALRGDVKANLQHLYNVLEETVRNNFAPADRRDGPRLTLDQALQVLSRSAAAGANPSGTGNTASATTQAGAVLRGYGQAGGPPPIPVFPLPAAAPAPQAAPAIAAGDSLDLALSVLLRQVAATIARFNVHQLHSLAQQQGVGPEPAVANSWIVELPVRHGEQVHVFQLLIDEEQERQRKGEEEDEKKRARAWKFTLRFDIEPLGPMYAQVRLVEQSVSARFWAEQPHTLRAVRAELDTLKNRLGRLGLKVEEMDCVQGAPPVRRTQLFRQLVDVKT